jgi:hypothetical protein
MTRSLLLIMAMILVEVSLLASLVRYYIGWFGVLP